MQAMPAPQPPAARDLLATLWQSAGLPPAALRHVRLPGEGPGLPSTFALGPALQAALAAATLAAAEFGRQRGMPMPEVSVPLDDVLRECSGRFSLDGRSPALWDKLSGLYPCGAEAGEPGWVRLHANFAHHRDGALALLGLPAGPHTEREAVARALRGWTAEAFETAAAERGLVVAAVRSPEAWAAHPQAQALAGLPLIDTRRRAPPTATATPPAPPWRRGTPGARPLQGLRVLDLTRILAGPVAGRTLAAQGAQVLMINSPQLPNIEAIADVSRGKRSAQLDLRLPADRERLRELVSECDVFLQAYRPGGLAALGFGADELARLRPGIVSVSLSAYGSTGPWAGRRGFDSLVQSATGLNVAEARACGSDQPRAFPLQALDYGAGFLLAFGTLAALLRQADEPGSHEVRISLAGVGRWIDSLGRWPAGPHAAAPDFPDEAFEESDSGFGRLRAVRHAARLNDQPGGWALPSMPPGSHAPAWQPDPA